MSQATKQIVWSYLKYINGTPYDIYSDSNGQTYIKHDDMFIPVQVTYNHQAAWDAFYKEFNMEPPKE